MSRVHSVNRMAAAMEATARKPAKASGEAPAASPGLGLPAGFLSGLREGALRMRIRLALCFERSRQRRALAALDERALKDIGLSRADVFVDTRKPFWR